MAGRGRTIALRVTLCVVAAGVMLAGSYALIRGGDNVALGGRGGEATRTAEPKGKPDTIASRVKNVPDLPPGVMVVSVPLGVNFQVPGRLYGTKAKVPMKLGPKDEKGTTQDTFGAPTALLLPDGKTLLYHFTKEIRPFPTYAPGEEPVPYGTHIFTPTIRIHDLATDEDRLLFSGARSFAWRETDGAFAYARGIDEDYRLNVTYLQRIMVQDGLEGEPVCWTSDADQYTVLQWVGNALIVRKETEGGGSDFLLFTGPDEFQIIASTANDEWLLGASDDGRFALISDHETIDGPIRIRTLDIRSGLYVSALSMPSAVNPANGEKYEFAWAAAWQGDRVVVSLDGCRLAVLSASDGSLVLEDVITLSYPRLLATPLLQPVLDESGTRMTAVADEEGDVNDLERRAIITYDLSSGECTRWVVPGERALTHIVSCPSLAQ